MVYRISDLLTQAAFHMGPSWAPVGAHLRMLLGLGLALGRPELRIEVPISVISKCRSIKGHFKTR